MAAQVPRQQSGDESPVAEDDEATWSRRENGRMRQINIGKARPEYKRYIDKVPKDQRDPSQPRTPEPRARVSKRQFDRDLGKWRRSLHEWVSNQQRAADGSVDDQESGSSGETPGQHRTKDTEDRGVVRLRLAEELRSSGGGGSPSSEMRVPSIATMGYSPAGQPGTWQVYSPMDQPSSTPATPAPLAPRGVYGHQSQHLYEGLETPECKPMPSHIMAWHPSGVYRCVGGMPVVGVDLQHQFGFSPVKQGGCLPSTSAAAAQPGAPGGPTPSTPQQRHKAPPSATSSVSDRGASSSAGGTPQTPSRQSRSTSPPRTPPAKMDRGRTLAAPGGHRQNTMSNFSPSPGGAASARSVARTPEYGMVAETPSPQRFYDQLSEMHATAVPFVVPMLPHPQHQPAMAFGGGAGIPWALVTLPEWSAGMPAPPSVPHM